MSSRTLKKIGGLAGATVTAIALTLALPGLAGAADTDGNGYADFLLREQPYLPYANAGAKCEYSYSNGVFVERMTVRPPRVWSLWGLTGQTVAWRARFVYAGTNTTIPNGTGPWLYGSASTNQSTDFGGGRSAPEIYIYSPEYWQAGEFWYGRANDASEQAVVDVAWLNPWTGGWTTNSLRVNYTYANGSVGPNRSC